MLDQRLDGLTCRRISTPILRREDRYLAIRPQIEIEEPSYVAYRREHRSP